MDVKLRWVRVKDPQRVEYWNRCWDLCGEIDPEVTSVFKLEAEVDGKAMGTDWTAEALRLSHTCGCGDCAECQVADGAEALRRLPVAA